MLYQELRSRLEKYFTEAEINIVDKAYEFAKQAHDGQTRNSGEPYITHPVAVAKMLAQLELDLPTIIAALLHDVVEDTQYSLIDVEKTFGAETAYLVNGVTKLGKLEFHTKEEQQVENLRKMFLAMAKDIRVILIKLADRLHNMRTLEHHPVWKQKEIARETMDIFAPLAHRLGIFAFKWELEDLAFRYIEQERYYDLAEKIAMKRQEREVYIQKVIDTLKDKLTEVGIKSEIHGRPKHFYSIYKKMLDKDLELNEIFDLIAVRVIVENVKDCYGSLGIIHTLWKPIPGRFKDYIAMPKPNMYQSLHTTVMGFDAEPFEIQIRTFEMHRTAEYGIAAHWKYKEGGKGVGKDFEKRLTWLRQILEWQTEVRDTKEFMETLKIDVFSDVVFVFTPKGDVIELPAGSVPIDFAYRIHSDIGHRCIGAKVNGRIVTLDYVLKNGDIVDVLTSKQANGPSRDWLKIVKTSQAKNRIRHWFKKEKREENIHRGRELLEKEFKKQGIDSAELLKAEKFAEIVKRFSMSAADDLLAAIGEGAVSPLQIITKLKDDILKLKKTGEDTLFPDYPIEAKKGQNYGKYQQGVRVRGVDDIMIRFAHCCNPLPGDPIIGYITRGRGVSVHRTDCPNVTHHVIEEQGRIVDVTWDENDQSTYQVEIEVVAMDRSRLTTDIMNTIADMKVQINAVRARATRNDQATVNLKIEIRSLSHLDHIMEKIKRLKGILEVFRVTPQK